MHPLLAFYLQLLLALASFALAFDLWHRGMPPVLAARGRLHALATWAQGMAVAVFGGVLLSAAMADKPPVMLMMFGQLCLIASSLAHLRRTALLGDHRWTGTPK